MDTSGYFPQLGDDDPLFEISSYSQLMKTKLEQRRHAEFTSSITTGAGTLWDPGVFTLDTANTLNNTFAAADVTGKIKILESGLYSISCMITSTANPGTGYILIKSTDGSKTYAAANNGGGVTWELYTTMPNLYFANANEILWFRMQTANAVNTSTRVRITKLAQT